jgi:hypothetical protein
VSTDRSTRADRSQSATADELRTALSRRIVRSLLVVAGVLSLVTAASLALALPGPQRTFSQTSFLVQSVLSLPLPLVSVLVMTQDVRGGPAQPGRPAALAPKYLACVAIALVGACFGMVLAALASAYPSAVAVDDRWRAAVPIALGSVLVQLVAQLCGAGFGLLLRSGLLAMVIDVVVPLGLWVITGLVPALRGAQEWLTPFASVGHLLSGLMTPRWWAEVAVVVAIWVVALNVAGIARRRRLER